MASDQSRPITPPDPRDEKLSDFSEVLQFNFDALFQAMPDIKAASTVPTSKDGSVRSIRVIQVSGVWRLYIKVDATTWKYVALS